MVDFSFMDSLSGRLFLYFGLFCGFLLILLFLYLFISRRKGKDGAGEVKTEPKRLTDNGPATSEQVIPARPAGVSYNNT